MDESTREQVEQIVENDEDVRDRIADLVERATHELADAPTRLVDFSRSTVEAAVSAVERAAPDDPESTLKQVVDGLADGLRRTANVTKLAVEEAAGEGRSYASEDLKKVATDLRTISEMFVETVSAALRAGVKTGRESASNIVGHAERTMDSLGPTLRDAASTASKDPVGLAGESAGAAAKLTREAAGSLFSAMGDLLKSAGDSLSPSDGGKPDAKEADAGDSDDKA